MDIKCYRCGSSTGNPDCERCIALGRGGIKRPEIRDRLAEAVSAWRNVMLTGEATTVTGDLNPVDQPQPNVIYMGQAEWRDTISAASRFAGRTVKPERFNGLLIVRVHLENYLQVAYVEGVK